MAARTPAAAAVREAIRVATYNVLGQCYTRSSLFPASPRACLRQKPRLAAVAAEVAGAEADFCCVQELERSFLDGVLAPTLSEHGLAALYKQRTGVRKSKPDGSAIIYRVSKWAPRKSAPVMELEFNDLAPEDADSEHTLVRDCVGLVAAFDAVGEEDGGQEGSAWGSLVVATAHLFWDPQHADVKEKQAKFLVERAQAYAEEHLGERAHRLVVGGDFNSLPESALIEQIQASGLKSAYSPWPEVCDKGLEFRFWGTPHPKERSLGFRARAKARKPTHHPIAPIAADAYNWHARHRPLSSRQKLQASPAVSTTSSMARAFAASRRGAYRPQKACSVRRCRAHRSPPTTSCWSPTSSLRMAKRLRRHRRPWPASPTSRLVSCNSAAAKTRE